MTTETELLALFEEGNPVPDLNDLGSVAIDAAAYLATLEQRSSTVTQVETKKREEESMMRSRRGWMIAAAVFVAVISVGVILTSQGGSDEAPVATDPNPTTTVATANLSVVGDWEWAGWLVSFSETGQLDLSSDLGTSSGTYETDDLQLSVTTTESTINNDEEFPNCIGEAVFDITFDDAETMSLRWIDGKCDHSWPSFMRLTKVEYDS